MNKKELEEYQDKLMSGAKGTMKLGIVTGVGSNVLGQVGGSVPGAAPGLSAANTALNLANVGNMAAVGMSLMPGQKNPENVVDKKVTKKKTTKKVSAMDDPLSWF